MKLQYGPDDGTQADEKRCAICGTIDKKTRMEFKKVENGSVEKIEGEEYKIACWVCRQCA